MDVIVAKIVSLLVLAISTVMFGLLPFRLSQICGTGIIKRKNVFEFFLRGLRCFSGGIFLGTSFLLLLPETRSQITQLLHRISSTSNYPLAELLVLAGFFAIVLVEQVIQYMYIKSQKMGCVKDCNADMCAEESSILEDEGFDMECRYPPNSPEQRIDMTEPEIQPEPIVLDNEPETEVDHLMQQDPGPDPEEDPPPSIMHESDESSDTEVDVRTVVKELGRTNESGQEQIRSTIYIVALSFHGVFEGMAVGLQGTVNNVWNLCFAVCLHRCVLAFGLGLQLTAQHEKSSTLLLCVVTFSGILVVGVVTGTVISSGATLHSDVNVTHAILQSVATGTILYIVFFEILFKDLQRPLYIRQISSTFAGFVVMAIILVMTT